MIELSDDRKTMLIEFAGQPSPAAMSAETVDLTIENMGFARGHMLPPVPSEWKSGQVVKAFRDPMWSIEPDALASDIIVHMRHHFGWMHFALSRKYAEHLAATILKALRENPPPEMKGRA
jgi:hypothetical protein